LIEPGGRIAYLILDGVGGLPNPVTGKTELQTAHTPHLDSLAKISSCGLLEIVGPGITPGSGPGHLAIFGYDPLRYTLGRGILSALGIDFDLKEGDIAARVNFATIDGEGKVLDRRAGRIDTSTNQRLSEKITREISLPSLQRFFFETVSEHRAVLVLRGQDLGANLRDTDPQQTGIPPHDSQPLSEDSEKTAEVVRSFIDQVREILSGEEKANMVLLRGFDRYGPFPSLKGRFGLKGLCIAEYPMYRGLSRLLGMEVLAPPEGIEASCSAFHKHYGNSHDFYFIHIKKTDSTGEDGDFDHKVKIIEEVDRCLPQVTDRDPDVLVVTGDHSTPSSMGVHSWHPVPVMIHSRYARIDEVTRFEEEACLRGALGIRPGIHVMGLALAHAGRLQKFGA
jgi:2,3-bisphosphoglycerate-independent phosphoglycerate mutase